jgi:hypothetical protein
MASGGQRDIEVQSALSRTALSEMWYWARDERAFIVSEEYTTADTGDTATLHLKNPSGSEETAVFIVTTAPTVQSYVRVYDEFSTAPSGGSDTTVQNILLDSGGGAPDSGVVTAATGVSFTASSTHIAQPIGGGQGAQSVGGSENLLLFGLEPDREVVIELEQLVSGDTSNESAITARWFEVPQVFSDTTADYRTEEIYR